MFVSVANLLVGPQFTRNLLGDMALSLTKMYSTRQTQGTMYKANAHLACE